MRNKNKKTRDQNPLINNIQNKYNFYNPAPNSNPFPE